MTFLFSWSVAVLLVGGAGACGDSVRDAEPWEFGAADAGDVSGDVEDSDRPYFAELSSGPWYTCGLQPATGRIRCWGRRIDRYNLAPPDNGYRTLAAGGYHVCAIRESDGGVDCWGANQYGQLADPGGTFVELTAGLLHTCGLRENGTITCWGMGDASGDNADHALNFGQATPRGGPFDSISAGLFHTCGLTRDAGTVRCWGLGDTEGGDEASAANLGVAVDANQALPPDDGAFVEIAAGGWHTCGIDAGSRVRCWGGRPGEAPELSVGQAAPPEGTFEQLAAGVAHTCGLAETGTPTCWGLGRTSGDEWKGQSDFVKDANQALPPDDRRFTGLTAGGSQTCGVGSDRGYVQCWGGVDAPAEADQKPSGE